MAYAIIALILLVALSPLWHFMPTKRQKHQARLREAAALAGLFVEFRDLPLGPERNARLPASERQALYYGLRLPASRKKPRKGQAWFRDKAQWRSPAGRSYPPALSEQLPESVLAMAVSEESCGIFWQERGDEGTVREIAALLEQWKTDLLAS